MKKTCLILFKVGDREDSNVYIRMKLRGAKEIGINANHIKLESSITKDELIDNIVQLNKDDKVHGIILQLPLDSGLNSKVFFVHQ